MTKNYTTEFLVRLYKLNPLTIAWQTTTPSNHQQLHYTTLLNSSFDMNPESRPMKKPDSEIRVADNQREPLNLAS